MKSVRNYFGVSGLLAINIILLSSCHHEQEIPVIINFQHQVIEENYTVPVQIAITNTTTGADFYKWTFTGAEPSSSEEKQPGTITYSQAGEYVIRLEAWNDTQRNVKEVTILLDSSVTIGFDTEILINDFAPATVQITNKTRGASTYAWIFEGGTPESSEDANPSLVQFSEPGDHDITLTVTNGRSTFITSKTITLKPALQTDFAIVPSFADHDYEAPLTATLENHTISGLRYSWSSTGGVITNPESEHASVYFEEPGEYVVTLTVENDKETQSVEHNIVVKLNTNLYIMENARLGVSAGHNTTGCFYSTKLRRVLTSSEISAENGNLIDIGFYGINSGFTYCRFISPDSASQFTFPEIPAAIHTAFINTLETTSISFTDTDFDSMINDDPLVNLEIRENDTEINFFDNTVTPRIVLFETEDGRLGAIKVKSFVSDGAQSYILVDIKVQKEPR